MSLRGGVVVGSLSVVVSVVLVGCGSSSGGVSDDGPKGSNAASAKASAKASASPSPRQDPRFGQTYTWSNGVSVRVARPTPFEPSDTAAVSKKWRAYRAFEITIVNKSNTVYDPTEFDSTLQAGDTEAEEVFDSERGFNGSPQTKVLPGRQSRFKLGFGVDNPADLVYDVTPGYEYADKLWTSGG